MLLGEYDKDLSLLSMMANSTNANNDVFLVII
jgi:hypothetical protein